MSYKLYKCKHNQTFFYNFKIKKLNFGTGFLLGGFIDECMGFIMVRIGGVPDTFKPFGHLREFLLAHIILAEFCKKNIYNWVYVLRKNKKSSPYSFG